MTDNFRRQCESALTHPVTLAALAVLLVNDLVLKTLWPHPWTTGKLSDLAWMVFAPPLLAYLLSFATRGNVRAQRTAFVIAYVGLPLLYAAFNTFALLHDWIMRGFSLVTDGVGGSPLDPWDSVVIPFAMGIAVWVWRRGPMAPGGLRSRAGMIAAGLTAFATVATSEDEPEYGIVGVSFSEDSIVAESSRTFYSRDSYYPSQIYSSRDGGITWAALTGIEYRELPKHQIGQEVETPAGKYRIEGADIILIDNDGGTETVYSARHLRYSSNRWFQERETQHITRPVLSSGPQAIAYDRVSGNVVLAMGIQGVVVGTPEDEWFPVPVDIYSPTEFSPANKAKALVSSFYFWAAVFAFPLTGIVLALLVANFRKGRITLHAYLSFIFLFCPAAIIVATNGAFWLYAVGTLQDGSESSINMVPVLATALLIYGLPVVLVAFFGAAFLAGGGGQGFRLRATIVGYLSMALIIALVYMVWLQSGIPLTFARVSAMLLCTVIAITLGLYLSRIDSNAHTISPPQC